MGKILWLLPNGDTNRRKDTIKQYAKITGFNYSDIMFASIHTKFGDIWRKKTDVKKEAKEINPSVALHAERYINSILKEDNYAGIVVNDIASGCLLLPTEIEGQTLAKYRGSVYLYSNLPVMIIDDVVKTYSELSNSGITSTEQEAFILSYDMLKLNRIVNNCRIKQAKFSYTIAYDVGQLPAIEVFLSNCWLITCDIETQKDAISSIAYTGIDNDGRVQTFVIPFWNTQHKGNGYRNSHWKTDDEEILVWQSIRRIMNYDIPKGFHNGNYDCLYNARYGIVPRAFYFDSMHMMHSIFALLPKTLAFTASLFTDFYSYWKDEARLADEEAHSVPSTKIGLVRYWRYNGLDTYNTLYAILALSLVLTLPDKEWALNNYLTEMGLQFGPAFAMELHGMRVNEERQAKLMASLLEKHKTNLERMRFITGNEKFNPFSNQQVVELIYDTLGAKNATMVNKAGDSRGHGKSVDKKVDEKVLMLLAEQHPILRYVINLLWDTKKPMKLWTDYCPFHNVEKKRFRGLKLHRGRFLYNLNIAKTWTGRFASSEHAFWCGTNAQNVPGKIRPMFVADKGFIFWEVDYSQSDTYFVAFESQDETLIRNVLDDRDTHCVHAAHFFKRSYEEVFADHAKKGDWTNHPITGIRQLAKKISHGANYLMGAKTMRSLLTREMLIFAARELGKHNPELWREDEFVTFTGELLRSYYQLYPRLKEWTDENCRNAVLNGNRATCYGGRTHWFFKNPTKDHAVKRELASLYGQGGTGGNINQAMMRMFYTKEWQHILNSGVELVSQTHDSLLFQVPIANMMIIDEILACMEVPCTIKGRTFVVPCEAELSFSWTKGGVAYKKGDSMATLLEKAHHNETKY